MPGLAWNETMWFRYGKPVPSVGMSWVEMAGVSARLDPVMVRSWLVKSMGFIGFNFRKGLHFVY